VKVTRRTCNKKVQVVADATGVVSHAGSLLLGELAAPVKLSGSATATK
jgi:hypothetical protein